MDSNFSPYVPDLFPAAVSSSSGNAVAAKRELRRDRVLAKQAQNKKMVKIARRSRSDAEAEDLINSFMGDHEEVEDEAMQCEVCNDDAEMQSFWNEVCTSPNRDLLSAIESPQQRNIHSRGMKPTRLQLLGR